MADLTISGSVAPINDVGTIKTRNATMKRMTVMAASEFGEIVVHRDPELGQRVEHERCGKCGDADERFGHAECGERPGDSCREAAAEKAPEAEARHESREHGAGRIHRDAKHQRQQPQPHYLVNQRAYAGAEEQQREQRQHPRRS